MTLLVFLGVLITLLILRLIPGLLLRLVLAIPRHRLATLAGMTMRGIRGMRGRPIGIALRRKSAAAFTDAPILIARGPHSGGRLKFLVLSSSLLVIAVLVTTAFWTWHSTGLMMLLR
jgi:hypothetical protein